MAVPTRTLSRLALALVMHLLSLFEQSADSDQVIARLFLNHEDNEVFSRLPGTGKRLAARLRAEIGNDPTRSVDGARLHALGGISPVLFQSGTSSKPRRCFRCINLLRTALHQFARLHT